MCHIFRTLGGSEDDFFLCKKIGKCQAFQKTQQTLESLKCLVTPSYRQSYSFFCGENLSNSTTQSHGLIAGQRLKETSKKTTQRIIHYFWVMATLVQLKENSVTSLVKQ